MEIVEPTKEHLNSFVVKHGGDFQQSWEWGEFEVSFGREIKRIMLADGGRSQLAASFFKFALPVNKAYWICPGGPVFSHDADKKAVLAELANYIKKELGGIFVRIEARLPASNSHLLIASRFKRAPKDHSPRATVLADLTNSEEDLLKGMHQKTRYNIRLAKRKGVKILLSPERSGAESKGPSTGSGTKLADFLELLKHTAKRDGFHLHPDKHYERVLELPFIDLFLAYYKDEIVAGAMVANFAGKATYLHGASGDKYRNVMAPYLLHWVIMKEMKARGAGQYDFGGVAPEGSQNHPWAGITRFKKGFGGKYVEYVGTFDYVISPFWYTLYKIGRRIL